MSLFRRLLDQLFLTMLEATGAFAATAGVERLRSRKVLQGRFYTLVPTASISGYRQGYEDVKAAKEKAQAKRERKNRKRLRDARLGGCWYQMDGLSKALANIRRAAS